MSLLLQTFHDDPADDLVCLSGDSDVDDASCVVDKPKDVLVALRPPSIDDWLMVCSLR